MSARPAVTYADTVAALCTYLRAPLAPVMVANRVPDQMPPRLVRLMRTGGAELTRVSEQVQVSVDCWAETSEDAHDLAQLARHVLHTTPGAVNKPVIYSVNEIGGPAEMPDPANPTKARFVFTIHVHVRGE